MIISVASGKGGTGKTTIATNLALVAQEVQLLDCDTEEPNAHFFIKTTDNTKEPVVTLVPQIDMNKCTHCGSCVKACAFNAMAATAENILIFPELCHSCGVCQYICPTKAISEIEKTIGYVTIGYQDHIHFITGTLQVGEAIPIPVIKAVKKHILANKLVIIDAPPGTSCPMLEAVKNSDFCVLVTEPTPFGLSDLTIAVTTLKKLGIPYGVIINRADLGNDASESYCQQNQIPILMKIPFSKDIAFAYAQGIPMVTAFPKYQVLFKQLLEKILGIL